MTNEQRHKDFNPQASIEVAVAIDKTIKSIGSCETCSHWEQFTKNNRLGDCTRHEGNWFRDDYCSKYKEEK